MARSILLVEDDPRELELFQQAFERLGLADDVKVARTCAQALDDLRRFASGPCAPRLAPRLVLLDLKLPECDGLDILNFIRANDPLHLTPVVIFTASEDEADVLRCYEARANAYIVKPRHLAGILQSIRSITGFWLKINKMPSEFA